MIIIIVQYKRNKNKILYQTVYKDQQRNQLNLKNSIKILKIVDFYFKEIAFN